MVDLLAVPALFTASTSKIFAPSFKVTSQTNLSVFGSKVKFDAGWLLMVAEALDAISTCSIRPFIMCVLFDVLNGFVDGSIIVILGNCIWWGIE